MNETITAIDTIAIRVPLDIWAPDPCLKACRKHGKKGAV
jgi:hypothetical protein